MHRLKPVNSRRRQLVIRMILDVIRVATEGYLHHTQNPLDAQDFRLCIAAALGQTEGRLMTAAQMGRYVGIPRATAVRRVAGLVSRGILRIDPDSGTVHIPLEILNAEKALKVSSRVQELIHQTCESLAKVSIVDT